MRGDDSDLNCRVINYLRKGDYNMIQTLFEIGFLNKDDTFDITGRDYRGNPEDLATMIFHVARYSCPNYKEVIDVLINNGVDINEPDVYELTPLYYANSSGSKAVAEYLKLKGATV